MQSTSLPKAITGPGPFDHLANQAVGIPETPYSIVNPYFFKRSVRYFEEASSWNPNSEKLNILSTIT